MMNLLNHRVSAGWVYVLLVATALCMFAPAISITNERVFDDPRVTSRFPTWTLDEIRAEYRKLTEEIESRPIGEPQRALELNYQLTVFEGAIRKVKRDGLDVISRGWSPVDSNRGMELMHYDVQASRLRNMLTHRYAEHHGLPVMQQVAETYFTEHPDHNVLTSGPPTDWTGVGGAWLASYLWSLPFIGLLFLIRIKESGLSVLLEFFDNLKPAIATAFWPVALWMYPNKQPIEQIARAIRFVSSVLAVALSFCFGGIAKAAEKQSDPKKQHGWSLQIDGHRYERLDDPDRDPADLMRVNLATPSGFYTEFLRLRNASSATSFLTAGTPVAHPAGGVVNAYTGVKIVDEEPEGSKSVLAGIQAFLTRGRFSFALPVAHVERTIASRPVTTLAVVGITTVGIGKRCYAGVESLFKRSDDGTGFWYAGPVLGWNINPALQAEAGCFGNSDEEVRCRVRAMHTLRW